MLNEIPRKMLPTSDCDDRSLLDHSDCLRSSMFRTFQQFLCGDSWLAAKDSTKNRQFEAKASLDPIMIEFFTIVIVVRVALSLPLLHSNNQMMMVGYQVLSRMYWYGAGTGTWYGDVCSS